MTTKQAIAKWMYGKADEREYPEVDLLIRELFDAGYVIRQRDMYGEPN